MTFEPKDIVQIDATVIIGVLFFLTLGINIGSNIVQSERANLTAAEAAVVANAVEEKVGAYRILTFSIILPFSVSAILGLRGYSKAPRIITGAGLVWLRYTISIFSFSPLVHVSIPPK